MAEDEREPRLRKKAQNLVGADLASLEGLTPDQMRGLIHELQMENEELRRAQAKLERSRNRYFELYDLAPVAYLSVDKEGVILQANLTAGDFLGQYRSHLIGRKFTDFVVISDQALWIAHLQAVTESGERRFCELNLMRRDGAVVTVHLDTLLVGDDESEKPVELRTSLTDITERKRAEEKIRHQNALFQGVNRIFEAVLTAPTEDDLGRTCLAVAEEITGSKFGFLGEIGADGLLHDIAISDPGWEACQMTDPAGHRQPPRNFKLHGIYGRVLLDGKGFFTNDPDSHPDRIGTPLGHPPLKAFLGIPLVRDRRTIGMVAVGNREGGYRQEQLEALEAVAPVIVEAFLRKRAEKTLQMFSQQRQLALDAARMGWWHYDPVTRIASWDDRYKEIFGVTGYESPNDERLKQLHPEDLPGVWAKVEAALDPASPQPYSAEYRINRPDGSMRWIEAHGIALFEGIGKNRRAVGLVGTVADITDRKHAEQALEGSSQELKLFAYSVAHDLKSPAIGVYGLTKRLSKYAKEVLDEKGRNYCDQILKASEHIAALVDKVNTYIATKEARLSIERISIAEILRMLKDEFAVQLTIRRIQWLQPETTVEIKADRLSMLRAFRNFVDNSLKYGGQRLSRIWIDYEESEDFHILSFSDNGKGLKEEASEKIFRAFQRDETSRGVEGAGLGLTIVKEIAEQHGGTVWVEPRSKKGITFYLSISKNL